jgi:hypothetical protein
MRTRSVVLVATLGTVAAALAGCPSSTSCPLETPQVTALPTCTEPPSKDITYPVRLCPTCNQTGATCSVQMSGNVIFLDLKVEACADAVSCGGAGCAPGPTNCTFTTPATEGNYSVVATDPGGTVNGTLVVSGTQAASCALASAGPTTF